MSDTNPQDDVMRQAVIGELMAIAFGNPRRVSTRDRLAALKMLSEVKGLWLQQQVQAETSLAEALAVVRARREAEGAANSQAEIGAVIIVPGKTTDWAQLAQARQDGLEPASATVVPADSEDWADECRRSAE